ncbi:hypothetical protein [Bradyrhizobium sp. USDA 4529]
MVALFQKLVGYGYWTEWRQSILPTPNPKDTNPPMVGKYRADYSRLTPEEIAKDDEELADIYANSRPVSR